MVPLTDASEPMMKLPWMSCCISECCSAGGISSTCPRTHRSCGASVFKYCWNVVGIGGVARIGFRSLVAYVVLNRWLRRFLVIVMGRTSCRGGGVLVLTNCILYLDFVAVSHWVQLLPSRM